MNEALIQTRASRSNAPRVACAWVCIGWKRSAILCPRHLGMMFLCGRFHFPMAWLEIRVPTAVAVFLIVLGLPASAAFLLWGVPGLFHPFHPDFGWGAALIFCGMGMFLLLMAIAAFRGLLRRKKGP